MTWLQNAPGCPSVGPAPQLESEQGIKSNQSDGPLYMYKAWVRGPFFSDYDGEGHILPET